MSSVFTYTAFTQTRHVKLSQSKPEHSKLLTHLALKSTSAQVVETSINHIPTQDYTKPDGRTTHPLSAN